jgi:hypothetical protein
VVARLQPTTTALRTSQPAPPPQTSAAQTAGGGDTAASSPSSGPAGFGAAVQPANLGVPTQGVFGLRAWKSRFHMESMVTSLVNGLSAATAKVAATEQKLQEVVAAAEAKQGVPHTECLVCLNACVNTVLLPCGHLCLCVRCARELQATTKTIFSCPLCRTEVEKVHRVFLPIEEPIERVDAGVPRTCRGAGANLAPKVAMCDSGMQTVSPSDTRARGSSASPLATLSPSDAEARRPRLAVKRMGARDGGGVAQAFIPASAVTGAMVDTDLLPARILRARLTSRRQVQFAERDSMSVEEVEEPPDAFDFVLPGGWEPNPSLAATWS